MILAVGNVKGGVGKTTLAINIAIAQANAGKDVLLVDGDEQQTAMTFTQLRTEQLEKPGYTAVSLQGSVLRTQVRQLAPKDRKSTRLNSSHANISYAVFCLKKKNNH